MTPPHRHKDNSFIVDRFIHTVVNHQQLELVFVFNSSVEKIIYFLNGRIFFFFNVLLILGHTWHAFVT